MMLFADYTLRIVALGSALLGIVAGSLGSFAVLRKQSLLGDSISHAALPGIVLAFMLTGSKSSLILLLGAAVAGWIGSYFILAIIRHSRISSDGAQGVILSVFFGIGLMLLTYIQSQPNAAQAGLDKYLFGQAAALLEEDIWITAIFGTVAIICMALFWKEFKLMTFDPIYGQSLGFSEKATDLMITALIVIAIVTGLSTVGVILMSSMLIAPASAARQWTNKMGAMVVLSGIFGALSGVAGALLSSIVPNLPTGPAIVLCLTALVILSLLFSPNRGILARSIQRYRNRFAFSLQRLLLDLYHLEGKHSDGKRAHSMKTISLIRSREGNIRIALQALQSNSWVEQTEDKLWLLTAQGHKYAETLLKKGEQNL